MADVQGAGYRKNFVELCERLTQEDEAQFEALWRYLGLSVDWKQNYQTIGARARKVAQAAFLRNLARGEAYQAEAPGLWDVTFQTAVAQAELESREYPGFYHRLAFHITDAEAAFAAASASPWRRLRENSSVATMPGAISMTRTGSPTSSRRSVLAMIRSACLAATYPPPPG